MATNSQIKALRSNAISEFVAIKKYSIISSSVTQRSDLAYGNLISNIKISRLIVKVYE